MTAQFGWARLRKMNMSVVVSFSIRNPSCDFSRASIANGTVARAFLAPTAAQMIIELLMLCPSAENNSLGLYLFRFWLRLKLWSSLRQWNRDKLFFFGPIVKVGCGYRILRQVLFLIALCFISAV